MATSWRGAQPLAGQSVAPFGDMCDSPPHLHSRSAGRQAGRQTTTRNATSNKLIIIIFAQPLPLSSSRQGADRETDGRTDRQANRETFVFGSQQQGRLRLKPCPGSCRAQLKAQHVAPKTPPGKGAQAPLGQLLLAVCSKLHFVYQPTHTHIHTHTHAHSGICIRMCL